MSKEELQGLLIEAVPDARAEKILARRFRCGVEEMFVKWLGHDTVRIVVRADDDVPADSVSQDHCTWVATAKLGCDSSTALVEEYSNCDSSTAEPQKPPVGPDLRMGAGKKRKQAAANREDQDVKRENICPAVGVAGTAATFGVPPPPQPTGGVPETLHNLVVSSLQAQNNMVTTEPISLLQRTIEACVEVTPIMIPQRHAVPTPSMMPVQGNNYAHQQLEGIHVLGGQHQTGMAGHPQARHGLEGMMNQSVQLQQMQMQMPEQELQQMQPQLQRMQ